MLRDLLFQIGGLVVAGLAAARALEGASASFGVLALASLLVAVLAARVGRTMIDVGIDGMRIREGLRTELIAFHDVESVELERHDRARNGTVILRRKGEARQRRISFDDASRAEALHQRIREAMEARGAGLGALDVQMLDRGDRTFEAWIEALTQLAGRRHTFRELGASNEALFRAVEDPDARPLTRAAAAIALGPYLDAEGRARLSTAASTTVAPKLRIALQIALRITPDATSKDARVRLAETLAELDEAEASARGAISPECR